jgi:hypothetical protein
MLWFAYQQRREQMQVQATLTEIRRDGMQKWERTDLPKQDRARYIWLAPYAGAIKATVGHQATLAFIKGTGGMVGGHWAGWRIV